MGLSKLSREVVYRCFSGVIFLSDLGTTRSTTDSIHLASRTCEALRLAWSLPSILLILGERTKST